MEMYELDNRIKRALLCKTNEIHPSEETFIQILAGLEKKKAHRTLNISYKHYIIALICAVSVLFGTILIFSVDVKVSTIEIINTVKTVFILDKSNKVIEKNDEIFNHATNDNTQLGNADTLIRVGINVFLLQTLLKQVCDLQLYLRILITGRMTLRQTLYYNKFLYRKDLAY